MHVLSVMNRPLMILIAGPYRSGTNDEPAALARNLAALETAAWPIFQKGHLPMIGEWVALPVLRGAARRRSPTNSQPPCCTRQPTGSCATATRCCACRAPRRAPTTMFVWPPSAACRCTATWARSPPPREIPPARSTTDVPHDDLPDAPRRLEVADRRSVAPIDARTSDPGGRSDAWIESSCQSAACATNSSTGGTSTAGRSRRDHLSGWSPRRAGRHTQITHAASPNTTCLRTLVARRGAAAISGTA